MREQLTLKKAVEKSISTAIKVGTLDENKHAAAIAGLVGLAEQIDLDPGKNVGAVYPTLLKFLEALHLVPEDIIEAAPKPSARLEKFVKVRSA